MEVKKINEYKWFTKQEILNMDEEEFAFEHKKVLEKYFNSKES